MQHGKILAPLALLSLLRGNPIACWKLWSSLAAIPFYDEDSFVKDSGCLIVPAVLSHSVCSEYCLNRGEHCAGVTGRSHQLADCQGNRKYRFNVDWNTYYS